MYNEYDPDYQDWMESQEANYSAMDQESNDRYDYASEIGQYDPERAAEIRMGA